MAGNVLEWTYSLYKPYPYTKSDGREAETSAENRAQRGGSWHFTARSVRAAYRVNYKPDSLTDDLGFRLALSGSA
jgi:formylglycine-generating enzyme required for sulfatase activity